MLLCNFNIVMHNINADGLQRFDNKITSLSLRSEGDVTQNMFLKNIWQ